MKVLRLLRLRTKFFQIYNDTFANEDTSFEKSSLIEMKFPVGKKEMYQNLMLSFIKQCINSPKFEMPNSHQNFQSDKEWTEKLTIFIIHTYKAFL